MAEVDAIAKPHDARLYAELRTPMAQTALSEHVARLEMDETTVAKRCQEAIRMSQKLRFVQL